LLLCPVSTALGKMVQRKLPPQSQLTLLSASGVCRCGREDHCVGCGEWCGTLWDPGTRQTYSG